MKAIPITKKLCTAGGGYASPAKIDPATAMKVASMASSLMGSKDKKEGQQQQQQTQAAPVEEKNKQTASEKKLFINE